MGMKGEITVFLSLVLVSILSLMMGLLESARTAGARLYLQMAADSSMASVMSQYNRNLWDAYHLLFLEYESERAIEDAFQGYFDFYLEQENLYPMKKKSVKVTKVLNMGDDGAEPLERGILAYMKYRLPEAAADLAGLSKEAADAVKAGDFRDLLGICSQAGKKTRNLERKRKAVEEAIEKMGDWKEQMLAAAEDQDSQAFASSAKKLRREMKAFPGKVEAYEAEFHRFSEYGEELAAGEGPEDAQAAGAAGQEKAAYLQAVETARQVLLEYQEQEKMIENSLIGLEDIIGLWEAAAEEEEDNMDWDELLEGAGQLLIPQKKEEEDGNKEAEEALDRLEAFFEKELLDLLLPEGSQISEKQVSLKEIPSVRLAKAASGQKGTNRGALESFLLNEYVMLFFESYLASREKNELPEERALSYELEYILCGKGKDRENLAETAEALLAVRGAMNLFWLLGSSEKKAQADGLAASVSGGNLPMQVLVSFFILSLWALGEAVWDVRILLDGGKAAFWKSEAEWRTSLEGLLNMEFLKGETGGGTENGGQSYEDYLRILLFLKETSARNYKVMDLLQWNLRKKQPDFSVEDCALEMEITAEVTQKHLFLLQSEYENVVTAAGAY